RLVLVSARRRHGRQARTDSRGGRPRGAGRGDWRRGRAPGGAGQVLLGDRGGPVGAALLPGPQRPPRRQAASGGHGGDRPRPALPLGRRSGDDLRAQGPRDRERLRHPARRAPPWGMAAAQAALTLGSQLDARNEHGYTPFTAMPFLSAAAANVPRAREEL